MRTSGVRTIPRLLLLVVTNPEQTFSTTELKRFRLRPFPLRELLLLAMPAEISSAPSPSSSLPGCKPRANVLGNGVATFPLTPLPLARVITPGNASRNVFHAFTLFVAFTTIAKAAFCLITIAVTIYSTYTPVLPPFFVATPLPHLVHSCPVLTRPTTVAVLLQTSCFAVAIVPLLPPIFYPFLVATLPLAVDVLATVSATITLDVPVAAPPAVAPMAHVEAFLKAM